MILLGIIGLILLGFRKQKKAESPSNVLNLIDRGMNWKFLLAKGTAGGILVGFKTMLFVVVECKIYEYCVAVIVKNQLDSLV
jgi:hypothetical protein